MLSKYIIPEDPYCVYSVQYTVPWCIFYRLRSNFLYHVEKQLVQMTSFMWFGKERNEFNVLELESAIAAYTVVIYIEKYTWTMNCTGKMNSFPTARPFVSQHFRVLYNSNALQFCSHQRQNDHFQHYVTSHFQLCVCFHEDKQPFVLNSPGVI